MATTQHVLTFRKRTPMTELGQELIYFLVRRSAFLSFSRFIRNTINETIESTWATNVAALFESGSEIPRDLKKRTSRHRDGFFWFRGCHGWLTLL